MRLGAVSALALGVATAGCAVRPQRPAAAAPAAPRAAWHAVREREAGIHTLRVRFVADSEHAGERRQANGVLLVKKPDKFRLRLMLPLGLTVLDYVSWGAHAQLFLPLAQRVLNDPQTADAPFSQGALRDVFLRQLGTQGRGCRARALPADVVVECRDAAGAVVRTLHIDPRRLTPREEVRYAAGRPRLVIDYADYRVVDGVAVPFVIHLHDPGRRLALAVHVQRYEVNPPLADRLFLPLRPWTGP